MKKFDARTFIAIGLITAGFLSALGLALVAGHKSSFLVANKPLAIGHVVGPEDFRIEKAALWEGANNFLSSDIDISGSVVSRFIGANELLIADMFATQSNGAIYQSVPLSVAAADMPFNLLPGASVDIYQVIAPNDLETSKNSKKIITNIRVLAIDRKGQNLGNAALVTLATPEDFVIEILNATRVGRIVLVSNAT